MVEAQAISTYSLLVDTDSKTGSSLKNRVWAVAGRMGLKQVLTDHHSFARSEDVNTPILKEQQELIVQSWNRLMQFSAIELKQAHAVLSYRAETGSHTTIRSEGGAPRWQ